MSVNELATAASPHAATLLAEYRRRRGEPAYLLACQAALPLSLSADLLHSLRSCFATDEQQQDLGIPWIAVADLLLSPLCRPIGHDPNAAVLFELLPEVRVALLADLKQHPRLGQVRMLRLGEFLKDYAEYRLSRAPSDWLENQRTVALAYVDPASVACELARRLRRLVYSATNPSPAAEQVTWRARLHHLDQLIESLVDPLGEQHADLPRYARGMRLHLDGLTDEAAPYLAHYLDRPSLTVAGVELPLLPKEVPTEESVTTTEDVQRLRQALEPVPHSLRGALRRLIVKRFPDSASLGAFIIDFFPSIYKETQHLIFRHMRDEDRNIVLGYLLEIVEPDEILKCMLWASELDVYDSDTLSKSEKMECMFIALNLQTQSPVASSFQPNKDLLQKIIYIKPHVVRQVLQHFLKSQVELREFILDNFHETYRVFTPDMDSAMLHSALLEYASPIDLIKHLCSHLESDLPLDIAIEIQEHIESKINTIWSNEKSLSLKSFGEKITEDAILRITRIPSLFDGYINDHFPNLKNPNPAFTGLHDKRKLFIEQTDVDVIFRTLAQSFPDTTERVLDLLQSDPSEPIRKNHILGLRQLMRTLLPDWHSFESFCEITLAECFWLLPTTAERLASEKIVLSYYSEAELIAKLQSAFIGTDILEMLEEIAQQKTASRDSQLMTFQGESNQHSSAMTQEISKIMSFRELRHMLNECLVTADEFNAFLIDYFPHIYERLSDGMDRTSRTTLLLQLEDKYNILRSLYKSNHVHVSHYIENTFLSPELVEKG